jgi:L-erythrulose 1-phosphate isomerase
MTSPRHFWIGTSWKMNKTLAEAKQFAQDLKTGINGISPSIQPFIIPPFTAVREVKSLLAETRIKVGAQNMHWEDAGAWTGEISPLMLKDCNLDMVELGHSERREHFGETDETVGLKTEAAVRHGLIPLVCVGETLSERELGQAQSVLENQVRGALGKLSAQQKQANILLAYEPVWAIGVNGIPATSAYADARQAEIIAVAKHVLGRTIPCLYGGSVNPGNCIDLVNCPHINGLFIGRSAWNATGFLDILHRCGNSHSA